MHVHNDDLGPMPEPRVEPGETNPGGVDAITGACELPQIPDLPRDLNPGLRERLDDPAPG